MGTILPEHKPSGKRYRAIVRVQGPDQKITTKTKRFARRRDADRWISKMETAIREGEVDDNAALTWRTLIDAYYEHPEGLLGLKGAKTKAHRRFHLEWWARRIGDALVERTGPTEIDRCLSRLRRRGPSGKATSTSTCNRYLSAISKVYKWGIRRHNLSAGGNPCAGLRMKEPPGKLRWLSDEERTVLLEECETEGHEKLSLLVHLGLTTGHRREPLVRLQWKQVDMERREIFLGETKNGEPLIVPLADSVFERLKRRERSSEHPFVFEPAPSGQPQFPRKAWERVRERVMERGPDHFTFHSLRHTAGSYLAQAGWSLAKIQEFLGHESYLSTRRYAHLVRAKTAHEGRAVLESRGVH